VELGYAMAAEVEPITDEIVEIQKMVATIQRKLVVSD
jgi:hypothetical protein